MSPDELGRYRNITARDSEHNFEIITVMCSYCGGKTTRRLCKIKKVYKNGYIQNRYRCPKCCAADADADPRPSVD